jgi:glycosyltransferase involved in cell wall biosynthesis
MKIAFVNTYDQQGGAAIAAFRLKEALERHSVDVQMLVDIKKSESKWVTALSKTPFQQKIQKYKYFFEKILFIPFESKKEDRFAFTTAYLGNNISKHPIILNADIIHIHWINHSFLSFKNLEGLIKLGKPIVITMHDMWYMTGGCHHARECINYQNTCENCQFLKSNSLTNSLVRQFQETKKELFQNKHVHFVGCSNWLTELGRKSSILPKERLLNIPNPINTTLYKYTEGISIRETKGIAPDKILLLYIAANVANPRKGYKLLESALNELNNKFPNKFEILVLGSDKKNLISFPIPTHKIGYVSDVNSIITYYSEADILISPTLEDNLPNTLIESMACGTPCVSYNVGGIPEIIDHKENGYVAEYQSIDDLVNGIVWVTENRDDLSKKCIQKVQSTFSEEAVVPQFISLYKKVLNKG